MSADVKRSSVCQGLLVRVCVCVCVCVCMYVCVCVCVIDTIFIMLIAHRTSRTGMSEKVTAEKIICVSGFTGTKLKQGLVVLN
jgi:hypothetical protein